MSVEWNNNVEGGKYIGIKWDDEGEKNEIYDCGNTCENKVWGVILFIFEMRWI